MTGRLNPDGTPRYSQLMPETVRAQMENALANPNAGGVKHDGDKPRMELLDADALEGIAQVLTFGAKKYASHNWRGGIAYSRLIAATLRHVLAFNKGEDVDPESGLSHIDHAACCLMFLANMIKTRTDLDDRYKNAK